MPCAQPIPVSRPRQCKWLFGKTQVASVIGPAASQSPIEKEERKVEPREDRQVSESLLCALPTRLSCISGENPGKAQSPGAGPRGQEHRQGPGPSPAHILQQPSRSEPAWSSWAESTDPESSQGSYVEAHVGKEGAVPKGWSPGHKKRGRGSARPRQNLESKGRQMSQKRCPGSDLFPTLPSEVPYFTQNE